MNVDATEITVNSSILSEIDIKNKFLTPVRTS